MLNADTDSQSKVMWLEYVLSCAFHLDHVMDYMSKRLEPQHIRSPIVGGDVAHQLVYADMVDYWKRHNERPGVDVLIRTLKQTLINIQSKNFGQGVGDLAERVYRIIVKVTDATFDKTQSIKNAIGSINYYYEYLVSRPTIKASLDEAMSGSRLDAGTLSNEILKSTSLIGAAREPGNVFSFEAISDPSVISSGLGWMNKLLAGGFRRGLAYGIIIPTGGGKTTLAGQLSFSVANMGIPSAVVYTEQSLQEPEMISRFWSLVTDEPYTQYLTRLRAGDTPKPEDLTPEQQETMHIVSNNIQAYDFSIKRGSIAELRSIAMGHVGRAKPEILFVDWAGQFAKDLLTTDESLIKQRADMTTALQYVADECALIAREAQIPVVVFHMMAGHVGSKPMRSYDHKDAERCKGFCNNLAFGLVVPPRDENHITRMDVTKGRYADVDSVILKLLGDKGRFVQMKNYKRGRYRYDPENRKPDEMPDVGGSSGSSGGYAMDFENDAT